MKNQIYLTAFKSAIVVSAALLTVSCVNSEYDLDKLNTEVTFAKSGLSFPLGNTKQITLKDFIGSNEGSDGSTGGSGTTDDYFTTVDGAYAISFTGNTSSPDMITDLTDKLHISDIVFEKGFSLNLDEIPVADEPSDAEIHSVSPKSVSPQVVGGESSALKPPFDEKFELILISAKELPADAKIKSVSQAVLDEVYANIVVDVLTDIGTGVNPEVEMSVDFPSEIRLDASDTRVSGNSLKIKERFKGGEVSIAPVRITELDLSKYDFTSNTDLIVECRAHGTVLIDDESFSIDKVGRKIDSKITLSIRNIKFKKLTGRFEYEFQSDPTEIDFSDVPSILKNGVLDFYNPYLSLEVKSNLNVPMVATIRLIPEWEEEGGLSDESKSESVEIKIPYEPCTDASTPSVQKFFVAAMDKGRGDGMKFIENGGIKSLLRQIPDRMKVETSMSVDSERESTIEPAVQAVIDADYSLVCPLCFGPDLFLEASDTLTGIDETLAGYIAANPVKITGSVINYMPLQLNLKVDLLDGSDNVLPLKSEAVQRIASCGPNGRPSSTILGCRLDVDESVKAEDIKSIKLTYSLSSGLAVGIPVMESSYVQAYISLTLPEGLKMDFKKKDDNTETDSEPSI